jgi:hypothetical protein
VRLWRELSNAPVATKRISLRRIVIAPAVFVGGLAITTLPSLWSEELPTRGRPRRAPPVVSDDAAAWKGPIVRTNPLADSSRPTEKVSSSVEPSFVQPTSKQPTSKQSTSIQPTLEPSTTADVDQVGAMTSAVVSRFNHLAIATEPAPTASASHKRVTFLPSGNAEHFAKLSDQHFKEARQLFSTGAFASAEASLWMSLEACAESVFKSPRFQASGAIDPRQSLDHSRTAITEARDFAGRFGDVDPSVIARMIRSHRTVVLKQTDVSQWSGTDASDAYLDYARSELAGLTLHSPSAARSLDLLAAVMLKRDDAACLPSATAICLRRAALQGQPNDTNVAARLGKHLNEVGLHGEATSVLAHAGTMTPPGSSASRPVMQIETMSPEQFAAISQGQTVPTVAPMVRTVSHDNLPSGGTANQVAGPQSTGMPIRIADSPTMSVPSPADASTVQESPSIWSRMVPSFFRGRKE